MVTMVPSMSRRLVGTALTLLLAALAAGAVRAGASAMGDPGDASLRLGPAPLGSSSTSAGVTYLPLSARNQDVLDRPEPPTADAPTATRTASPAPTPTVFACAPLAERLRVREIDVYPREVKVQRGQNRGTSPIFLAPDPVGDGAHVAWSDMLGGVYVTALDYYDLPTGQEVRLDGAEVRGLVVHEDGVAVLVVREDSLYLVRLDADGTVRFETRLVGGGSQTVAGNKWVDSWGHEARLVWAEDRYGVYSGHTQQFGSQGKHQGDLLWFFDAEGFRIAGADGWDWGCSHSLDLRLAHNGNRFGPVCLSDSYPTKGFHFNHRTKVIRSEPSGDAQGYSAANLGGWVPLVDGFLMSFTSPEGRQSSDVGLVHVGNDATIGPVAWLTDSADVAESEPHLARFGTRFLAGWTATDSHLVASLDDELAVKEGPITIDAPIAAKDDMVTFPNGDVAWAYAWDDFGTLKIARVEACDDTVVPTVPPTVTAAPATATATGTPATATPRPTRTPRRTGTPGTAVPSATPEAPGTPPTAAPLDCRELLANGDFESGLDGWTFDGEVALRGSDRSGGRYGAMLLGRNAVEGRLSQSAAMPAGATAVFLTYWWHVSSDEPVSLTRAYDTVAVALARPGAGASPLEVLSNLAGRDAWLPSAYLGPLVQGALEVTFSADSNGRDASRITIDDVSVVACTGATPVWPVLAVEPSSVAAGAPIQADALGQLRATFAAPATAGAWAWCAAGHQRPLPARAPFTVTSGY